MGGKTVKFPRIWTLGGVIFAASMGAWFGFFMESDQTLQVVGLPKNYQLETSISSYSGVHPRLGQRPEDPFVYPINLGEVGPIEPIFSGPLTYPFLCKTDESGWGQPLIDNLEGVGVPVYAQDQYGEKTEDIIGYSKDCLLPTHAQYYYMREGTKEFYPLQEQDDDIKQITIDGKTIDFIVRFEVGVINRYLYGIAVLKGIDEDIAKPNGAYWNKRLVYQFRGGVGIGRKQGKLRAQKDMLNRLAEQLAQGYAVVSSSANHTKNHYNLWVSEEVALRVKNQFIALYGKPLYTVGIGGSGGAIQQYILAQNNPNIIDAAIPLYSYPDMVTQKTASLDCELLEHYFDVIDKDNTLWHNWENRSFIEGTNADNDLLNKYQLIHILAQLAQGQWPDSFDFYGLSECVNGWRGLGPLVHNPRAFHFDDHFTQEVKQQVHWSHWEDLKYIYGVDEKGFAKSTWDNIGIQYGLKALTDQKITKAQFLNINRLVGSWKSGPDLSPESYWFLTQDDVENLSIWSEQNIAQSHDQGQSPAPRLQADIEAIHAIYRSGQVFVGHIDIPIIDLRHYLDKDLDMHHSFASFSVRQRMLEGQGSFANQIIWMTQRKHNPIKEAFSTIDRWMLNIISNPEKSVAANKPIDAVDRCYDQEGEVIAQGEHVWDGAWNNKPQGECLAIYPNYRSSRMQAGLDIKGYTFKCQLQPIDQAMAKGIYQAVDMTEHFNELQEIFPNGVCDYTLPDQGLPADLGLAVGRNYYSVID